MIIVIIIAVILLILYWKLKPIKNSHYLPQIIEIKEVINPENSPNIAEVIKGHKLFISREKGQNGYHLFVTIDTNEKDLTDLKKIIVSWSAWPSRHFNFRYNDTDDNVLIEEDQIKIDIGSFNNCPGSKNFLTRTASSDVIKIDLLDYNPGYDNYEYEKDYSTQSVFLPGLSIKDIKLFKKGLHFLDS
jgi:hypothetical protein